MDGLPRMHLNQTVSRAGIRASQVSHQTIGGPEDAPAFDIPIPGRRKNECRIGGKTILNINIGEQKIFDLPAVDRPYAFPRHTSAI